jgi:hypothetical protein
VEDGSINSTFNYEYQDIRPDFLHMLNEQIALQARAWIVADSQTTLRRYIPVVESEQWKEMAEKDKPAIEPVRHLMNGFIIPRDPPKRKI